jgi:hypothetical protein
MDVNKLVCIPFIQTRLFSCNSPSALRSPPALPRLSLACQFAADRETPGDGSFYCVNFRLMTA